MDEDEASIGQLRDQLQSRLANQIPDRVVNGDEQRRLAGNLHLSIPGVDNAAVQTLLRAKVALSTSSACSSGAMGPSHVLRALGLSEPMMAGALRFGIGKFTTEAEIICAVELVKEAIDMMR